MKKLELVARLILGLIFLVFGLNGFFQFLPMPPPPPQGGAFLGALAATGYMFPVIKGVEVLCGIALLSGVLVPLALILLAPIVVNILLYHTLLDPSGAPMALAITALGLFLAWSRREKFAFLFQR
jgi:putative oxidoreductase